ncbi:hypothetical protein [Pseudomonas phage BL2]|uniref:Uncharacterized protein n=1 Tax=Pseudomonas phage Baskent_P2_ICU TaxID=3235054 RepID=A0AB39AIC0_9CAUD|nr:hypothetical protein [Pseudomonas phage BL2]
MFSHPTTVRRVRRHYAKINVDTQHRPRHNLFQRGDKLKPERNLPKQRIAK